MSDTITRRDAFHVLDICRFASEAEKKYAYSLMEQVASADDKDTNVLSNDTISREMAIDAVRHAWAKGLEPSQYIEELPSAQPERTCVNCGRTANNGGWYADGRTRCPIEEHYALPKDGYCHLWEKRNVTDDDYPERMEE